MILDTVLVGYSGFVGSNLRAQRPFDALIGSSNIREFASRRVRLAVVAAGDARKWYANQHPQEDEQHISRLSESLQAIECEQLVHFSTVDVYAARHGDESGLNAGPATEPYGAHRLRLERELQSRFARVTTIRLPGLFGPGLKKNLIFDLMNGRSLAGFNPRSTFQWFDLAQVWSVAQAALEAGLDELNVTSVPIEVAELLDHLEVGAADTRQDAPLVNYDLRSRHADVWGGSNGYLFSREETLRRIANYVNGHAAGAT